MARRIHLESGSALHPWRHSRDADRHRRVICRRNQAWSATANRRHARRLPPRRNAWASDRHRPHRTLGPDAGDQRCIRLRFREAIADQRPRRASHGRGFVGWWCSYRKRGKVGMPMHLRILLLALAVGLIGPAHAQDNYPNRPIRIVLPFAAGGGTDAIARILAQKVSQQIGVPVIIENKSGANGNIGAEAVAKAPADGYTL